MLTADVIVESVGEKAWISGASTLRATSAPNNFLGGRGPIIDKLEREGTAEWTSKFQVVGRSWSATMGKKRASSGNHGLTVKQHKN